jgi:hypothetical protein
MPASLLSFSSSRPTVLETCGVGEELPLRGACGQWGWNWTTVVACAAFHEQELSVRFFFITHHSPPIPWTLSDNRIKNEQQQLTLRFGTATNFLRFQLMIHNREFKEWIYVLRVDGLAIGVGQLMVNHREVLDTWICWWTWTIRIV